MVTLKDELTGKVSHLIGAEDISVLSDCVLSQMGAYNRALDLCPDDGVREGIKAAQGVLRRINEALCNIMPEER